MLRRIHSYDTLLPGSLESYKPEEDEEEATFGDDSYHSADWECML